MPLILDENQSSTGFFDLLHDSWSAFPTFALIDHTMRVRAKPWTLENNSNSNSCDGNNGTISGFSGGSTNDFIQQLVDECGDLCSGENCSTDIGDVNDDAILNIQDIITMVNHILSVNLLEDCLLDAADMNMDEIINIQDLISLVNAILGTARSSELYGKADVKYIVSGEDMVVHIDSDIDFAGIQLSLLSDKEVSFSLENNVHIIENNNYKDGINYYLAYSLINQPFNDRNIEILINDAGDIGFEDIVLTVSDINGDALNLSYSQSKEELQNSPLKFEIEELYPNPFNPVTQINISLSKNKYVKLVAYDIKGNEVDIIFEGQQSIGQHSYIWNAKSLPTGLYYIQLESIDMISVQKALLIK